MGKNEYQPTRKHYNTDARTINIDVWDNSNVTFVKNLSGSLTN